jgi:hypothetical protein
MQIFRQYKLLLPLIVCTLITVGLGIALLAMGGDNDSPHRETESVTETEETEVITVETPFFKTDLSAYERYIDVPSGSFLTLVNKTQTIDGNYDPGELVRVKDARRDIDLQLNAAKAMEAMFIEMRAAEIDDTFVKKIIGDAERITCRPADKLSPELDALREKIKPYMEQDEDVLSYALFEQVALKFFEYRKAKKYGIDADNADAALGIHNA